MKIKKNEKKLRKRIEKLEGNLEKDMKQRTKTA